MTKLEKKTRNVKILKYLTAVVGTTPNGKSVYPTYEEAGKKFGLHSTHIFRIKKQFMGLDSAEYRVFPKELGA